ncbi:hypothetical protein AB0E01_40585 [Nocardia vinacea]|uniref:hypothetical protein n=1 Tax=Nocardia vinacea TaxID=96468 RepID=UPI0033C094F8
MFSAARKFFRFNLRPHLQQRRRQLVHARRPHEPGESLSDTDVRKTREQRTIDIYLTGLAGIFTTPSHLTSNDEVGHKCTIVCRVTGEPISSSETAHIEWVPIGAIADLPMNPAQRERIDWALTQQGPHIDVPTL